MESKKIMFGSGDVIFKAGAYESWFYDILAGKVGIYADYGGDNEKLLTTLESGQTLGEMGMIECYPRSATAVALEDGTQLAIIDSEIFSSYFSNKPEKLIEIMKQLSGRIRELTDDYLEACRVLNETVEGESNDQKKKALKKKLKKFLDDYSESIAYAARYDIDYWHYGLTL